MCQSVFEKSLLQDQLSVGNLYNLEATPAEGCSYRFAKTDVKNFPDIITAGVGLFLWRDDDYK